MLVSAWRILKTLLEYYPKRTSHAESYHYPFQIMNQNLTAITIGSPNSEYLFINVVGRECPLSSDYWDGNWVRSTIKVSAGGFTGKVKASLRSEEFVKFKNELSILYETLSGQAYFTTMEKWLSITVVGDGLGHFEAQCKLSDNAGAGTGNTLHFSLHFDQTFIPEMIAGLNRIITVFPVIGN